MGRISTIRNAFSRHSFPSPNEEAQAKFRHILPLKTVVDYCGERIGFYFGWVELLVMSLTFPAAIGALMFLAGVCFYSWDLVWGSGSTSPLPPSDPIQWVLAKACDNYATPVFSAIMVIWATTFVELWQRRSKWYSFLWRVEKLESTELERPPEYSFKFTKKLKTARCFRPFLYLPSILITLFFIIIVFFSVYFINVVGVLAIPYCPKSLAQRRRDLQAQQMNTTTTSTTTTTVTAAVATVAAMMMESSDASTTLNYTETMMTNSTMPTYEKTDKLVCNLFSAAQVLANSFSMFVLDFIYIRVCYILTDWEHHKTQSAYRDSLVLKVITQQPIPNIPNFVTFILSNFSSLHSGFSTTIRFYSISPLELQLGLFNIRQK